MQNSPVNSFFYESVIFRHHHIIIMYLYGL